LAVGADAGDVGAAVGAVGGAAASDGRWEQPVSRRATYGVSVSIVSRLLSARTTSFRRTASIDVDIERSFLDGEGAAGARQYEHENGTDQRLLWFRCERFEERSVPSLRILAADLLADLFERLLDAGWFELAAAEDPVLHVDCDGLRIRTPLRHHRLATTSVEFAVLVLVFVLFVLFVLQVGVEFVLVFVVPVLVVFVFRPEPVDELRPPGPDEDSHRRNTSAPQDPSRQIVSHTNLRVELGPLLYRPHPCEGCSGGPSVSGVLV